MESLTVAGSEFSAEILISGELGFLFIEGGSWAAWETETKHTSSLRSTSSSSLSKPISRFALQVTTKYCQMHFLQKPTISLRSSPRNTFLNYTPPQTIFFKGHWNPLIFFSQVPAVGEEAAVGMSRSVASRRRACGAFGLKRLPGERRPVQQTLLLPPGCQWASIRAPVSGVLPADVTQAVAPRHWTPVRQTEVDTNRWVWQIEDNVQNRKTQFGKCKTTDRSDW